MHPILISPHPQHPQVLREIKFIRTTFTEENDLGQIVFACYVNHYAMEDINGEPTKRDILASENYWEHLVASNATLLNLTQNPPTYATEEDMATLPAEALIGEFDFYESLCPLAFTGFGQMKQTYYPLIVARADGAGRFKGKI